MDNLSDEGRIRQTDIKHDKERTVDGNSDSQWMALCIEQSQIIYLYLYSNAFVSPNVDLNQCTW
jgi:hypothetical protein